MKIDKIKDILFNKDYFYKNKIKKHSLDITVFDWYLYYAPFIESRFGTHPNKIETKNISNITMQNFAYNLSNCFKNYVDSVINRLENNFNLDNDMYLRFDNIFKVTINNKEVFNYQEKICEEFYRHLRNSIAHGNVYVYSMKKEKFVLFYDYNPNPSKNVKKKFDDLKFCKKECVTAMFLLKYDDLLKNMKTVIKLIK